MMRDKEGLVKNARSFIITREPIYTNVQLGLKCWYYFVFIMFSSTILLLRYSVKTNKY